MNRAGSAIRRLREGVAALFLAVALLLAVKRCLFDIVRIEESSMWPVLEGGTDRVLLDRTAREPARWELWMYRVPAVSRSSVKRVLGFPGEYVDLRAGDLWAGRDRKALSRVRRSGQLVESMLAPVHPDGRYGPRDFRVEGDPRAFDLRDGILRMDGSAGRLRLHLGADGLGIRDDYRDGNGEWRAGEHAVADVRIRFEVAGMDPEAEFSATHRLSGFEEERTLRVGGGRLVLHIGRRQVDLGPCGLPLRLMMETLDGIFRVVATGAGGDRHLLFEDLRDTDAFAGRSEVAFTAACGGVEVRDLAVLRDVHYAWPRSREGAGPYLLDSGYFLAGDNGAVSLDSRDLGPIAKRWLLGRIAHRVAPRDRWGSLP